MATITNDLSNEQTLFMQHLQGVTLTWTADALWSYGSWRRTSQPVSLSCGNIPVRSLLCDGRTPAGPAAAGYETLTAAPSIWTAPPAGYGFLSIKTSNKKLFTLLSQQYTTCPGQKQYIKALYYHAWVLTFCVPDGFNNLFLKYMSSIQSNSVERMFLHLQFMTLCTTFQNRNLILKLIMLKLVKLHKTHDLWLRWQTDCNARIIVK